MICILKMENGEIKGWLIADGVVDAIQRMPLGEEHEPLVDYLANVEEPFPAGKHELPTGHVLLAS